MTIRIATLALGLAALTVACGDRGGSAAKPDSSLERDLALANQQPAQPSFQDTAVAPAPAKAAASPKQEAPAPVRRNTAPQPKREPPRPAQHTPPPQSAPVAAPQPIVPAPAAAPAVLPSEVAAGSAAELTAGSKVCTNSNRPGDKIVATLNSPLTGTNGKEIPVGSTVVLEVASAASGSSSDSAHITFRVRSIVANDKTYTVDADVTPMSSLEKSKVTNGDPNAGKKKVAGGAIAGALLGQILGHSTKSTIIGAAAGAAAGAVVAKSGEKWEACLPSGGQLKLKLVSPLVIS